MANSLEAHPGWPGKHAGATLSRSALIVLLVDSSRLVGPAAFSCALLGLLLTSVGVARADWDPIPDQAWTEPARPDSGGGDAILLLDQSDYRHEGGHFRCDYFFRARVFTREGRSVGTVEIDYFPGVWKLSQIRARSVQQNGRSVEWDPGQLVETELLRYAGHTWSRAVVLVPGVEPGCIVEWGYTLEGPSGEVDGARFQLANQVYTCKSVHTWWPSEAVPAYLPRSWTTRGIHKVLVQADCTPSCEQPEHMTLAATRLPGIREEILAPPASDVAPEVIVYYGRETSLDYWSEWKHLFDQIQEQLDKDPGNLAGIVDDIRAKHPIPDSALAACFRWIQTHLHTPDERPWSERFGPSQEPDPPANQSLGDLLERSEAGSFEIQCLMVAMATHLGLDASIGFVGDRRLGGFDRNRRSIPPFNLVTVVNMRDGGTYYLQPDSRFAPFGSIPWYFRGGTCLLSGKSSDLFRDVPPGVGARARAQWNVHLALDDQGHLRGTLEGHLRGEASATWRRALWDQDPALWSKRLREWLETGPGFDLRVEARGVPDPPDSDLVVRAEGNWPDLAAMEPDRIGIPISRLVPWRMHQLFPAGRRKLPVLFENAQTEIVHLTLDIPRGVQADHVPDQREFSNDIGAWQLHWTSKGDVVVMDRRLELSEAEVPSSQYALVQDLFQRLSEAEQGSLVLRRHKVGN
jgi:hypothetical protein